MSGSRERQAVGQCTSIRLEAGAHRQLSCDTPSRQNLRGDFSEPCSGHVQCSLPLETTRGARPLIHRPRSSGARGRAAGVRYEHLGLLLSPCMVKASLG